MEAVKSTRGTEVVRSKEGAPVAAALEPATLTAAPAPSSGNLDWSSCSVRLEVISITGAGDAVGCWLLTAKVKEQRSIRVRGKMQSNKASGRSCYLNSSSELSRETEGRRANAGGAAESRGSTVRGLFKVASPLALGDEEPVSSISGLDCFVGELAEPDSPFEWRARFDWRCSSSSSADSSMSSAGEYAEGTSEALSARSSSRYPASS